MRPNTPIGLTGPTLAAGALCVAALLILAHFMLLVPITYGDQFGEIVWVYRNSTWDLVAEAMGSLIDRVNYIRPLEYLWRAVIVDGFGGDLQSYNRFQVGLFGLTLLAFLLINRLLTWRDFAAFSIALALFIGHHSVQATWELNLVLSNGVVLLFSMVILVIMNGSGGAWSQVLAVLVTATAMLTKEVGLILPVLVTLAWLFRFRGIRFWTVACVAALSLAYVLLRLRAGVVNLDVAASAGEHKASELMGYISNVLAGPVMFLFGEPKDGQWVRLDLLFDRSWTRLQILASLSALAILAVVPLARRLGPGPTAEDKTRTPTPVMAPVMDWRWPVLALLILLACSALGFFYTRHRHFAAAVPLLAQSVFLASRVVLYHLEGWAERVRPLDLIKPVGAKGILVALVLLSLSSLWTLRAVAGGEFLRQLSGKIRSSWIEAAEVFDERTADRDKAYLALFLRDALNKPHALHPDDTPPFLTTIGSEDSVNR